MFVRLLALGAALAGPAMAQDTTIYHDTFVAGSPYGDSSNNEASQARERFKHANLNPNATQSFHFAPFHLDGVFNDGSNAIDQSNQWTLRINVSDYAVPDARQAYPGEQPALIDPHVTNTVFELAWPERGSLRSALNDSTNPVCVAMTRASFRPNVTNLLTDDNDSADCAPVLGEACTNALLASSPSGALDSCSFDTWEDLPACASTLGASRDYAEHGLGRTSFDINSDATVRNASYADATDGAYGFASLSTEAYNATDPTVFDGEVSRLYVMLFSFAPRQGQSERYSRKALCVRVDARLLDFEDDSSSGGGGSSGSSEASSDSSATSSENLAPTRMPAAGKVAGALFAAGLGWGLYDAL